MAALMVEFPTLKHVAVSGSTTGDAKVATVVLLLVQTVDVPPEAKVQSAVEPSE
jgi:hypothetical protein